MLLSHKIGSALKLVSNVIELDVNHIRLDKLSDFGRTRNTFIGTKQKWEVTGMKFFNCNLYLKFFVV